MKTYRINCAQVRSQDPLVVRTRCGTKTFFAVDGGPAAPLLGDGDVHLSIDAGEGTPSVPKLAPEADDFAPNFVQLTFQGPATATVDGAYLVVKSAGRLWVTCGAILLPVSENALREAQEVAIDIGTDRPAPHSPVKI
jgi:hypothetical protein